MNAHNFELMQKMDRATLERLCINLWDEMYCGGDENVDLPFPIEKSSNYIKHLESENERLTKAVSGMYQDIKLKSLRFFIDARPTDEQRDIFANLFKNYLK